MERELEDEEKILEILRNNPQACIINWKIIQKADLMHKVLIPIRFETFLRLKPSLKIDETRKDLLREYYVLREGEG